jgi:hypothetical protein
MTDPMLMILPRLRRIPSGNAGVVDENINATGLVDDAVD